MRGRVRKKSRGERENRGGGEREEKKETGE